jgi:type I restriction enzyme S subunit
VPFCAASAAEIEKFRLLPGDIVIARTGATVGYSKVIKDIPETVFASYLVRVRVNGNCDPVYIGLVIGSDDYKAFVKANAGGAAQPNANARVLTSYPVPLPPLATQRKIAAVLSAYDDLIDNNNRRIRLLEEMAERIYQEWFVDFRYPGHEKVSLEDSKVGPIPKRWAVERVGDRLELAYGKALKAGARRPGNVTVFGSSGAIGTHDEALAAGPGVIVGRKGNVGSVYWSDGPYFAIDTTYWVRSSLPLTYCYYALRELEFLDSHAAVPGLSREQAYSLPILVPDPEIVAAFDDQVLALFAFRRNLLDAIRTVRATWHLLLPRLVAGEIDITDLDIVKPPTAA